MSQSTFYADTVYKHLRSLNAWIFTAAAASNKSQFFHTPPYSDHWTWVFDNHLEPSLATSEGQLLVKTAFNSPAELVMHRISSSGGKLPDSESDSLMCCCVIFQTFTVFQHWTYSTRIVSLSSISVCVCVWWFVIMCMQSNFELFSYNPLSQHSYRKFGEWTINCITVHYPFPVPVGYLICYPTLSSFGRIPKMLSGASPSRSPAVDCQYQCNVVPDKTLVQNNPVCVEWNINSTHKPEEAGLSNSSNWRVYDTRKHFSVFTLCCIISIVNACISSKLPNSAVQKKAEKN